MCMCTFYLLGRTHTRESEIERERDEEKSTDATSSRQRREKRDKVIASVSAREAMFTWMKEKESERIFVD